MKRILVVLILILAFLGLSLSAYLAQHEASGTPLLCNLQNLSGCNIVASSPYSKFLGIPLSQYGMVFYGALFILAAAEIVIFNRILRRIIQLLALIGVVASIYFTFVQAFLIGAFCIYCLASAVIAFLIFVCATLIEPIKREVRHDQSQKPPSDTESKNVQMSKIT